MKKDKNKQKNEKVGFFILFKFFYMSFLLYTVQMCVLEILF